jgi:hypothetical protein
MVSAALGCDLPVRALLQALETRSRTSVAVPFEKTPWVADVRIANLGLLDRREATLEVRFVRDLGFPTTSLQLSIDDALVADFWEREALALWLAPGRHRISCLQRQRPDKHVPFLPEAVQNGSRSTELELDLQPGTRPCVRLAITGAGPRLTVDLPAG